MVYTQSEQAELDDAAEGFYSRFAMKKLLPDEYSKHYPAPIPLALPNNAAAMQALIDALPPLPCFISEMEDHDFAAFQEKYIQFKSMKTMIESPLERWYCILWLFVETTPVAIHL